MNRLVRSIRRHLQGTNDVERFVRLIVGGGIALVVGLWVVTLANMWSLLWVGGTVLTLLGIVALGGGIWSEIDV